MNRAAISAVPFDAALGREDGPSHLCEPPRKPWRHRFDNMVRRFEPGDIGLVRLALDPAEADEGVHLVDRLAHAAAHQVGLGHVPVAGDLQQARLVAEPRQQAIVQRPMRRHARPTDLKLNKNLELGEKP